MKLTDLTDRELAEGLELAGTHLTRLRAEILDELDYRESRLEEARLEQEEIASDPIAAAVL